LLSKLKPAIAKASRTHQDHAKKIAGLAEASAVEAAVLSRNRSTTQHLNPSTSHEPLLPSVQNQHE
jgi:hypothetical protein